MKKIMVFLLVICVFFAGCSSKKASSDTESETTKDTAVEAVVEQETPAEEEIEEEVAEAEQEEAPVEEEPEVPALIIYPLPDTTMENLTDAILSVSLEEGDAYVDDTGAMQMDVKIYTYYKYDMVDISMMKVGDIIVTPSGEVEIVSMERNEGGILFINGGLEAGGFDLVTDDSGIFFETGFDDARNWYEVGEATIRVSADFKYLDQSDLEQGEVLYYPGSFLVGEVTDYNFTPYNTTIRVEGGQIVEMTRVYTP